MVDVSGSSSSQVVAFDLMAERVARVESMVFELHWVIIGQQNSTESDHLGTQFQATASTIQRTQPKISRQLEGTPVVSQ